MSSRPSARPDTSGGVPLQRSQAPPGRLDPRSTPWDGLDPDPPRSLRQELSAASGFSFGALLLAVGGSAVGTVLTSAAGTGQWGTFAGAVLGPVLSTTFSTRRAGEKGRVRTAAVLVLSLGALLITVTGVSLGDAAAGRSVVPGSDEQSSTFPGMSAESTTAESTTAESTTAESTTAESHDGSSGDEDTLPGIGPGIALEPSGPLDCGSVGVDIGASCATPVTVTSTGTGRLHVTRLQITGQDRADFTADKHCARKWLDPGESCEIAVRFHPSAAGRREATLVVHQNLPSPDDGTEVTLTGTGDEAPAAVTLGVEVEAGDVAGVVVSEPSGIECVDTCSAAFEPGTEVTLSIRFDQDRVPVAWDGCDQSGDTCTVRLAEDRTVHVRLSA